MNIFLEIYLVSGVIVGFFEGLFLETSAKKLFKDKKMKSIDEATASVRFGIVFIAITPVINTLHIFIKVINFFFKKSIK